jgi:hypothetical protein
MSKPEAIIGAPSVDQINAAIEGNMKRLIVWSDVETVTVDVTMIANDAPVIVAHNLGDVPTDISVTPWQFATWCVTVADRRHWNRHTILFHASAEGRYDVRAGLR